MYAALIRLKCYKCIRLNTVFSLICLSCTGAPIWLSNSKGGNSSSSVYQYDHQHSKAKNIYMCVSGYMKRNSDTLIGYLPMF